MNVAFSELENWQKNIVKKGLKKEKIKFIDEPISVKNSSKIKDVEVLGVFIHTKVDKKLLDKLPNLKLVIAMSVGFDHIDLDECKSRGINVSNIPDYGTNTVAEHAFGLILTLSRKIHDAVEKTRKNDFDVSGLMGFDLHGKTLGIVGVGRIGNEVIRMAKGFGMNILASDRHPKKIKGVRFVSLNRLLKESDIVSLHVPLVEGTKHLINRERIGMMKKGSYLINVSRGGLVDVKALKYGLDHGILAGAGLDVLEGENNMDKDRYLKKLSKSEKKLLRENKELLKDHDVVITPHSAFYSLEAVTRIMESSIEIVKGFEKGKGINRVI
jgi:D-lactate dehydrogenase